MPERVRDVFAWIADEPRVWFTSTESFAKVLSAGNRELLHIVSEAAPGSIEELAQLTGRAKVTYDRVELDLPITHAHKRR